MARHAVLIGNSRYPNAPSLGELRWPERDVDDLAAVLEDPELGQFGDNVRTLKDHSSHEIEGLIHEVLLAADKNDLVVIYFSGHGKRDRAGNLWLAAVDTDVDRLQTTAVETRRIRNLVNEKPHRRVVLILDCCYAAAAGVQLRNSVEDELQQVAEQQGGQGFYILAASGATQTSQEKEADLNGLYTKHLLAGIRSGEADRDRDGWISVDELHDYVREQVVKARPQQQPRKWGMDTDEPLLIARSCFKPREQRATSIRQCLLELAAADYIDDGLLTEALRIASQPVESLDEEAARKDRLLDDLLEDKLKPAALLRAWIQAGGGNTETVPESGKADDSKSDNLSSEPAGSAAESSRGQWFERLKVGFFILAVTGFIAWLIIDDIVFDRAELPNLNGTRLEEAKATLDENDWKYVVRRHFNPTVDSGTILDQDPPAGTTIKPSEDRILLIVAESATVPDLVGLKLHQARELLNLHGLTLTEPETRIDATRRAGAILEQEPAPGRKVEPGTVVRLVVAGEAPEAPETQDSSDDTAEPETFSSGQVFRDSLQDGGEGPEMVMIPADEFQMGSPEDEVDRNSDERQHTVTIKQPFAIGKHEVTVGEFRQFVEATDYQTEAEQGDGCYLYSGGWQKVADASWKKPGFGQDENHPVVCVSWNDAVAYVDWVSEQTGERYRLPTEAEWEYAARARTTTPFHTGACIHTDQANYNGNYDYNDCGAKTGVYRQQTVPVGSLPANPWGLHEVHGNVWEWTCSEYDSGYGGAETRCASRDSDAYRAVRGGSWFGNPTWVRSAYRFRYTPDYRSVNRGFRLARSP